MAVYSAGLPLAYNLWGESQSYFQLKRLLRLGLTYSACFSVFKKGNSILKFLFTASSPYYTNVVLDYLNPKKELIHQRFCINIGGVDNKDLKIIGNRNLKDMVISDNAVYSFRYQLENEIPIVSLHDGPYDKEFYNLMDYVQALTTVDDIRDVKEKTIHLRTLYEDYINEF